jgi:NhaP-type Na+/H+ or K+/H+ antiporter
MNKFALIVTSGLLVLSSSLSLVMAVVVFLYWLFLDQEPRMQETFPLLLVSTGLFFTVMAAAGGTAWSLYREHWSRWALFVALWMVVAFVVVAFGELLF